MLCGIGCHVSNESHQVFLSYASPDRAAVRDFYEHLVRAGISTWMDCYCLRPGQNWDFEISRALSRSAIVVVFVSKNSIDRRGFLQREISFVLDRHREKLVDDVYAIPVLLDSGASMPEQLQKFQYIRADEPGCKDDIVASINHQFEKMGASIREVQNTGEISWTSRRLAEAWDGIPGYNFAFDLVDLSSKRYRGLDEIGRIIEGEAYRELHACRSIRLMQDPLLFGFTQDADCRVDIYEASFRSPSVVGRMLSIQYAIHFFGAGAAHPNMIFRTYAFLLEPLLLVSSLSDLFSDSDASLNVVQDIARSQLLRSLTDASPTKDADYAQAVAGVVRDGTGSWSSFAAFSFDDDGVSLLFSPSQVAAYAEGAHFAKLRYEDIAPFMKLEYARALGISHLMRRRN